MFIVVSSWNSNIRAEQHQMSSNRKTTSLPAGCYHLNPLFTISISGNLAQYQMLLNCAVMPCTVCTSRNGTQNEWLKLTRRTCRIVELSTLMYCKVCDFQPLVKISLMARDNS